MQMAGDLRLVPTEPGLVVADVVDRHAGEMGQQVGGDGSRPAGLAGEHHAVGGDQRLAGDARVGIGREIRVQHRVAEPVGHLVGVTFGDGFGGEQELARIAHGWVLSYRRVGPLLGAAGVWRKAPWGSSIRAGRAGRAAIARVAGTPAATRESIRAEECARNDRPERGRLRPERRPNPGHSRQVAFRPHGGFDPDQCGTLGSAYSHNPQSGISR